MLTSILPPSYAVLSDEPSRARVYVRRKRCGFQYQLYKPLALGVDSRANEDGAIQGHEGGGLRCLLPLSP